MDNSVKGLANLKNVVVVIPPHLREYVGANLPTLERINTLVLERRIELFGLVAKSGLPLDEICALILWDDVEPENGVVMLVLNRDEYRNLLAKNRGGNIVATTLSRLMGQPADGFLRVMVVVKSGHVLRLRLPGTSAGSA